LYLLFQLFPRARLPRRSILVFISFILLALYLRRSKGYTEEVEEISSSSSFRISFPLRVFLILAPFVFLCVAEDLKCRPQVVRNHRGPCVLYDQNRLWFSHWFSHFPAIWFESSNLINSIPAIPSTVGSSPVAVPRSARSRRVLAVSPIVQHAGSAVVANHLRAALEVLGDAFSRHLVQI
jgi:hypothetical protein